MGEGLSEARAELSAGHAWLCAGWRARVVGVWVGMGEAGKGWSQEAAVCSGEEGWG